MDFRVFFCISLGFLQLVVSLRSDAVPCYFVLFEDKGRLFVQFRELFRYLRWNFSSWFVFCRPFLSSLGGSVRGKFHFYCFFKGLLFLNEFLSIFFTELPLLRCLLNVSFSRCLICLENSLPFTKATGGATQLHWQGISLFPAEFWI